MGVHWRKSSKMLFSLLLILPLASSLPISFSPSKSDTKPLLGVVYESLCPYSRQFIREQVHPAYTTLSEFFDVEFIAYGGASTHGNAEDGYTFEWQHGPRECAGNIVQGCTVHHVSDMMMQVELLNCMSAASKPEEAGEECFTQFGATGRLFRPVLMVLKEQRSMPKMERSRTVSSPVSGVCPGLSGMELVEMR